MKRLYRVPGWLVRHVELLLVVGMALAAALPLFLQSGLLATRAGGDSPFLLQRTQQLVVNLRAGIFPARWMPDGALGLGYPFYDFYASLPYYLAALLDMAGFGTLLGIKLAQTAGMLLAALASYWLARELTKQRWAGLAVSAVYTCAPFHLVNIYVRGDSLGEFYAMAWFPLILLGIYRLRRLLNPGAAALLAFSYAALVLSHNISALVFSPLALLFLSLAASDAGVKNRWRYLAAGLAALGLGLALSLWFWLPALREQPLVQLQEQTTGYFHYSGHFRWKNLVQFQPIFDYTIHAERNPFQMGVWQLVLAAAAILGLIYRCARLKQMLSWQIGALIALLGYTYLMTPFSAWLWDRIPLLPMTQFPWRLLSVQALAVALLVGVLFELVPEKPRAWIGLLAAFFSAAYGLLGLRPVFIPLTNADITSERLMLYEGFSGNLGSTVRAEYLPRWLIPRPYSSAGLLELPEAPVALEGTLESAQLLDQSPNEQVWQITVPEASLLAFQTAFYPGWQASVDGTQQGIEPLDGLGLLGLRLSPGEHDVRLFFEPTTTRKVSSLLSLAALFLWGALLVLHIQRGKHFTRAGALLIVLVLSAVWLFAIPHPTAGRRGLVGPLVQDFAWAPLLHHEPGGIQFGMARLLNYALDGKVITPGSTYRVSLEWDRPVGEYAFTVKLVSVTAHLLEPAPVWVEATVPVGASELLLDIPPDLPPGMYVLRLAVSDGQQAVKALNSQGVEMGLLSSAPLTVSKAPRDGRQTPALAQYGPPGKPAVASLMNVSVRTAQEGMLEFELVWRSEAQAPLNYQLSLRLKTVNGEMLANRDLPPFYGIWPATLWRAGEIYTDRIIVPISAELTDDTYVLEVVLYDRLTLQAVGTAVINDLRIR